MIWEPKKNKQDEKLAEMVEIAKDVVEATAGLQDWRHQFQGENWEMLTAFAAGIHKAVSENVPGMAQNLLGIAISYGYKLGKESREE